MTRSPAQPPPRRSLWRRQLILPAEHGSWAWLLVPFGVATAVSGSAGAPVWLLLLTSLTLFLLRQPVTVWLRVRQGRARRSDGPLARFWVLLLGGLAAAGMVGLLLLDRGVLLWLGLPLALLLALYITAARRGRASLRSLWMELAGAAGLALTAPAVAITASGSLTPLAAGLWLLLGAQNVLGALYVRLRIADTRGRPAARAAVVLAHAMGVAIILAAGAAAALPWGTAVPFAAFLLRAAWAARRPRPVANVKQFGFLELAVNLASGLWIIAAYRL